MNNHGIGRMTVRSAGAVFGALALCATCVHAGSLQVMPTNLRLAAGEHAQGLWLSNTGNQPLNAQVRVFLWTQVDGEDHLDDTDALIASPPMLTLAAGERQLVRIVRPEAAPLATEASYRLLIDELPDPNDRKPGVHFVLRYSVPVFAEPAQTVTTALRLRLQVRDGRVWLVAKNSGGEHAQFSRVSLVDTSGHRTIIDEGLLGYVLPGAERRWPVPLPVAALSGGFRVKASVNAQPFEQPVPVEPVAR